MVRLPPINGIGAHFQTDK